MQKFPAVTPPGHGKGEEMGKGQRNRQARAAAPKPVWTPTQSERKVMIEEINKEILKRDAEYWLNFDACILWTLHKSLGFGEKRLKKIFTDFNRDHQALREYYEVGDDAAGNGFIARRMLKEDGIDLEAWEKEEGLR